MKITYGELKAFVVESWYKNYLVGRVITEIDYEWVRRSVVVVNLLKNPYKLDYTRTLDEEAVLSFDHLKITDYDGFIDNLVSKFIEENNVVICTVGDEIVYYI